MDNLLVVSVCMEFLQKHFVVLQTEFKDELLDEESKKHPGVLTSMDIGRALVLDQSLQVRLGKEPARLIHFKQDASLRPRKPPRTKNQTTQKSTSVEQDRISVEMEPQEQEEDGKEHKEKTGIGAPRKAKTKARMDILNTLAKEESEPDDLKDEDFVEQEDADEEEDDDDEEDDEEEDVEEEEPDDGYSKRRKTK